MPENNSPSFGNIEFNMPKNQSNVIKVIGVGGGGSNAVNHMLAQGINGVDFVVCNTDAQALENSQVPTKIQLGVSLTEGLGAGANPEVGQQSALESQEEIKSMLSGKTKMVFINAGMGGGTGTGAAPVIAKIAKEMDLLTIGVVTTPFGFEGKSRNEQARKGIAELSKYVDSMVVINNNKLRDVYGDLGFKAGFSKADEVLATASRGIAEVITHHYTQNIDLRDAKTVLANSGTAIMGSAKASGKNRAKEAIMGALDSPLLDDNKIEGAKNVLLLIVSGKDEITIDEIGVINDYIQDEAKSGVNIIMGVGDEDALGDSIAVTIVATGFHKDQQSTLTQQEPKKVIHILGQDQKTMIDLSDSNEFVSRSEDTVKHTLEDTNTRIVHSLEEAEEVEEMELIPTSEILKNMDVVYDEISYETSEDFIITPAVNEIEVIDHEVIKAKDRNQTAFAFKNPIVEEKKSKEISFDLTNSVNDIEVNNPEEIVAEVKKEDTVVFDLGDFNDDENKYVETKKLFVAEVKVVDEVEMVVKEKVVEEIAESSESDQELSPMHLTISELRNHTEDRKSKMKNFNYKFNNKLKPSNIDEIEKVPAYKRNGVQLDNNTLLSSDTNQSKTTLSVDENNDLKFRANNSYLHDNVD